MELNVIKLPRIIEVKVRTWYRLHNKNRNGFMSRSDFADMAQLFIEEYDLGTTEAEDIRSWLVDGWSSMLKFKASGGEGIADVPMENIATVLKVAEILSTDGTITEDMYVKAYSEALQIQPSPFPECFRQMVTLFFNIFDANKDGYISEDEMVRGLRCFGIKNAKAVKALFSDLDTAKTGKIDKDTYVGAWVEFMTGVDKDAAMAKHFTPAIL